MSDFVAPREEKSAMAHWISFPRVPGIKNIGRSFKYSVKYTVFLLLVAILFLLLSLVYRQGYVEPFWQVIAAPIRHHPEAMIMFLVGCFAGIAYQAVRSRGVRELTNHLWIPLADPGFYLLVIVVLAAATFFWALSVHVAPPPGSEVGFLHSMRHDPGGVFAVFMGLLTVIGFALTLQGLWEIRRTITSFSDLIFRLNKMLNAAKEGETVRMLCYTPSLGYIALDEREFSRFAAAVTGMHPNDTPRAEMICLGRHELGEWHELFIGRQTRRKRIEKEDSSQTELHVPKRLGEVTSAVAAAATSRGEKIVTKLTTGMNDPTDAVKRLPPEFMPGYYFFFSNDRAILAAPLYLPFAKGTPKEIQKRLPPVADMIGFETNDKGMINDLRQLYNFYQRLPSAFIAETKEPISASEFEKWAKSERVATIMGKLVKQFNIARDKGTEPADGLTEEDITRRDAYAQYLGNDEWLRDTKLEVLFRVMLVEEVPEWKRKAEQPKSKELSTVSSSQFRQTAGT